MWRGNKTVPRPQKLYRAGIAPSGFAIPGSAPVCSGFVVIAWLRKFCKFISVVLNINQKNWLNKIKLYVHVFFFEYEHFKRFVWIDDNIFCLNAEDC